MGAIIQRKYQALARPSMCTRERQKSEACRRRYVISVEVEHSKQRKRVRSIQSRHSYCWDSHVSLISLASERSHGLINRLLHDVSSRHIKPLVSKAKRA